jgi:hypothetical protein
MPRKGWWEDEAELTAFARALAKTDGFANQEEVVNYFEEPWQWTEEYQRWVEAEKPEEYPEEAN